MADISIAADRSERSAPDQTAAYQLGSYAFRRMKYVEPVAPQGRGADDSASAVTTVIRNIQYPRLCNPEVPARIRFNALMAQRPRFRPDELTNEVVDYEIVYAGGELISVRFDRCYDTIGAAHPWGSRSGTTILMLSGELLEPGDVFAERTNWLDYIARRAADEIDRQFHEYQFTPAMAEIRSMAGDVDHWLIGESALVLLFPVLSFGAPFVAGSVEVAIPWADLAEYLNPNAPAPIAAFVVRAPSDAAPTHGPTFGPREPFRVQF